MSSTTTHATVLTIIAALLVCTTAGAGITATTAVTISGGSTSPCAYTHGWRFKALSNIILTTLGTWDEDGDGLPAPVEVGIWDDAGNLLDSVTVGTNDPITAGFRYASDVLSVNLTKNSYYRIGSCAQADSVTDRWGWDMTLNTASDIDFDTSYYNTTEHTLTYPNTVVPTWQGYFGPNFKYIIPEPISLLTLAAGAGLLLRRRRR